MLDKLKAKIVEAVPEIMELKFGCEVEAEVDTPEKGYGKREIQTRCLGHYDCDAGGWNTEYGDIVYKDEIKKNLGRPITLEDVLRALNRGNYFLSVSVRGAFYNHINMDVKEDKNGNVITWQLGKPLSEQSKETIEFLYNLIK